MSDAAASVRPVGVAVLGMGTVGTEVIRYMTEHSDELTARIGGPLALRGVAVRDLSRDRGLDTALLTADGALTAWCGYRYELRLHRARGYGALKAILEILAQDEPLTLTEIAVRLQRTPGSTKDYLSWLEDVDLVVSRQKRYSFADPLLRLWVRLHCRPVPPSVDEVAHEVQAYAASRLPEPQPTPVGRASGDRRAVGIIEID